MWQADSGQGQRWSRCVRGASGNQHNQAETQGGVKSTGLIGKLLATPPRQPEYRRQRSHAEFVTRLKISSAEVKAALREAWNARNLCSKIPDNLIRTLVANRYSRDEWNFIR